MGDRPSFLIISLRSLGDVLVTTPLAQSIKARYPKARVDYLVFAGGEAVLAKNPYVDTVHALPKSGRWRKPLTLFKKYDYALATNYSDRAALCAVITGKQNLGIEDMKKQGWWKTMLLSRSVPYDDSRHVVHQMLGLLEPLGIPMIPELTMAFDAADADHAKHALPFDKYLLLHPYSSGAYKYWPAERWGELARRIASETDCTPVFTKTGSALDDAFLQTILKSAPAGTQCFAKPMTINQLAATIGRSAAYIGVDTLVTHVAAAVGSPTVAIYGPSYTRYWAPWPKGCTAMSPFERNRGLQSVGNVTVIQKDWECVPCNRIFCRISKDEKIECLETLRSDEVFDVLLRRICINEQ